MATTRVSLVRAVGWTIGGFGVSQVFKLVTNVILARLLAPEIFGVMLIVNSVRTGVELISDVGISRKYRPKQRRGKSSFLQHRLDPPGDTRFATLVATRCAIAVPMAAIYQAPILSFVLPIAGLLISFLKASVRLPAISCKNAYGLES